MIEFIETVTGLKSVSKLGKMLPHEHIGVDLSEFYVPPLPHLTDILADKIDIRNVGYVQQHPYSNMYNLKLDDAESKEAILKDIALFREFDGGTIIENSSYGLKRNLAFMKEISEKSGVNIIVGTGFYAARAQTASTKSMQTEEIYNWMLEDLSRGCQDYPAVKAGFIGELASGWPLDDFEKRVLEAAAEIGEDYNTSVSISPAKHPKALEGVLRYYEKCGGNAENVVICHVERLFDCQEKFERAIQSTKCFYQFDMCNTEPSFYLNNPKALVSTLEPLKCIHAIKELNCLHQVFLSNDIHTKHKLTTFGGHGFAHIFTNVIPILKMMGITEHDIRLMMSENILNWLN